MARRLTMQKLATYQAVTKEIEERCYDVQQLYSEYLGEDEEDAPYEYQRFYMEDYHVVIVLQNWEAIDVEIKIPNEVIVLPYNKLKKRVIEIFEGTDNRRREYV